MFSIDTETGFPDLVLINAAYRLGETVEQGAVNPDELRVFKPTLLRGSRPIIGRRVGSKEFKLIYDSSGSRMVKNVPVPQPDRDKLTLTDDEVLTLARWACRIEGTTATSTAGPRRWTWSGRRMDARESCSSCKPGRRRCTRAVRVCRTVDEGRRVVDALERHGLRRGVNGLEIYVMCEVPSNVILAEGFSDVFDGSRPSWSSRASTACR